MYSTTKRLQSSNTWRENLKFKSLRIIGAYLNPSLLTFQIELLHGRFTVLQKYLTGLLKLRRFSKKFPTSPSRRIEEHTKNTKRNVRVRVHLEGNRSRLTWVISVYTSNWKNKIYIYKYTYMCVHFKVRKTRQRCRRTEWGNYKSLNYPFPVIIKRSRVFSWQRNNKRYKKLTR